jgi:hypothetical protein
MCRLGHPIAKELKGIAAPAAAFIASNTSTRPSAFTAAKRFRLSYAFNI